MEEKELEFCEEWLALKKYNFKILAITTVLADEKRAFRGTLKEFCKHLNIQSSSPNITKILESLAFLEQNDFIKTIRDKNIFTISLAKSAEKSKKIIKIKKSYYQLIREYEGTASWENNLKVFLYITELSSDDMVKYADIGKFLGISKKTVQNCVKAVTSIDFGDFVISKDKHTVKDDTGSYTTLGQTFVKGINFE